MTILAIMSLVLALCGATVTGIKESRTVMADRVRQLVNAAIAAFDEIDKAAGTISQGSCDSSETRKCQKNVHDSATSQKLKFDRGYGQYEIIIWVPIIVLSAIAIILGGYLAMIPVADFKSVVTNPQDWQIRVLQWMLIVSLFLNLFAVYWMGRCRNRMQSNLDSLSATVTTFIAAQGNHLKSRGQGLSENPATSSVLALLPSPDNGGGLVENAGDSTSTTSQ